MPVKKVHSILIIGSVLVFCTNRGIAALTIIFQPTEDGGGTKLTASGFLDITGQQQFGSYGSPRAELQRGNLDEIRITPTLADSYRIDTRRPLFDTDSDFFFSTSIQEEMLVSGDSFGFVSGVDSDFTAIYTPRNFTSGFISGQAMFINAPLSSMQVIEQEFVWGPGDGQRASIQVVPEPTSIFLIAIGSFVLSQRRRRTGS